MLHFCRAGVVHKQGCRLIESLAVSGALLAIAIVDFRWHRIPDLLSLPLLAAGLISAALADERVWSAHAIGAAVGYSVLALFGSVYYRVRGREGLGLGDAKLFGAAGAWLGWSALPMVLLVASLGGLGFAAVAGRVGTRRHIAFGPWLALGFWVSWVFLA